MKQWLIKHWWVNELLKFIAALFFALFSYATFYIALEVEKNGHLIGFVSGILAGLPLLLFTDIYCTLRKKPWRKQ